MPMTIYKLSSAAAGDSVASLDIQLDGVIRSIHMSLNPAAVDLIDDGADAELSFLSSNTFTNSDVRGSLMIIQSSMGLLTQGGSQTAVNAQISALEIPVNAGERIHLHLQHSGGTASARCHAYLFVEDKGVGRMAGRRR